VQQKLYSITTGVSNDIPNNSDKGKESKRERNRAHVQSTVRCTVPVSARQTRDAND